MNSIDRVTRLPALDLTVDPIQPTAAAASGRVIVPSDGPLFATDRVDGSDALGRAAEARFLAEVVIHQKVETPFCIGLFGAAGSGKSTFLDQMMTAVRDLAGAAGRAGVATPFVADVAAVRVDVAAGDPERVVVDAVIDSLAADYPDLAADLAHAGADPQQAARDANEALNEARGRLATQRQSLDVLGGREARLVDGVLEAPGSRIDAYARANRSRIEQALRPFGFAVADPVATYKGLVREAAEGGGALSRIGLCFRALWTYRGQARLLVLAILFALAAMGLSALQSDQGWIGSVRDLVDKARPAADWAQGHLQWLGPLHTASMLLAAVLLLWAITRAVRFVEPIFRGETLLRHDLDERRREIKGALGHQTKRVDGLAAEVEAAAQRASEADRRATAFALKGMGTAANRVSRISASPGERAAAVFQDLRAAMAETGTARRAAPRRIVIAIDGLDDQPSAAAAGVLGMMRRWVGAGVVTIVTASRAHLAAGFSETDPADALTRFERCVQLSYRIDSVQAAETLHRNLATRLIGGPASAAAQAPVEIDASRSALDRPWRPREADTLVALAMFAGDTPRAVKYLVNVYRVARADPHLREAPQPVLTALALALALDAHGFPDDLAALERASRGEAATESSILRRALAAAREASGEPVELGQAQRGLDVAGHYSIRL